MTTADFASVIYPWIVAGLGGFVGAALLLPPKLGEALGGLTMFARIGIMRALNRHVERVFDTSRKPHHWGKRKLKGGRIRLKG
jgi:hypothetical protein